MSSSPRAERFFAEWRPVSIAAPGAPEAALAAADPRLGLAIQQVIAARGPQRFPRSPAASHFDALVRAVVYQQLSMQAAATIYGRLVAALGGAPSPDRVRAAGLRKLRAAGLSNTKARCLLQLSRCDLRGVAKLSDEQVIDRLCAVRGIGRWTAEMFLMFRLGRPDVLPAFDAGIRQGLRLAHGLRRPAAPGYVARAGKRWIGHQSLACLYLWALVGLRAR
jgi:DNA-3-methyladenine glycosylase II